MINLLIGSLAITLAGTSVLAGESPPMEQTPGVPTPPAIAHKENVQADDGAGSNSPARVTEQKSVGGIPLLISKPGVVDPNTRLVVLYHGRAVIRISVCDWATTPKEIERSVRAFVKARAMAAR